MNYNTNKFRSSDLRRGGAIMAAEVKRMTFVVTPDMEKLLDSIKREWFYNCTQSDMIWELVSAGVRAVKAEKAAKENRCERVS